MPVFSVIMATWGRGRHILPSIRSVLMQDFPDLELIVVGDACTDDTEAVVATVSDPRLRWINLPSRCGSQSGPNNAGIAAARGEFIAYLGHDDIWEPDHLGRLHALFLRDRPADFAVSGVIFHLPNDLPGSMVLGIFADGEDASRHFFPPSCFSHRKTVIDQIGPWRMPLEIRPPVDEDFLLRATDAGLRFLSTEAVTVHKFAAGHRYLSYVEPESREQEEMLAGLATPDHKGRIAAIIEAAHAGRMFMPVWGRNFDGFGKGQIARLYRQVKGLNPPPLLPLGRGLTLPHPKEPSMFDWEEKLFQGFRKTKSNPRPRMLLPVSGGRARLRFSVLHLPGQSNEPLEILCNGERVIARPWWYRRWLPISAPTYQATLTLRENRPSLLEFLLTELQRPGPSVPGIAIGPLHLAPV